MTYRNRIGQLTASIGTGPLTLGAAITSATAGNFQALAAADDTHAFDVLIVDGAAWEIATGCVYSHATQALTRGTLEESSTGAVLALSGNAKVYVTVTATLLRSLAALVAALPVDENGVINANVTHRTGALNDLLNLTTAGNGEVAVATDADAIVVFKGSPSVGKVYGHNPVIGEVWTSGSFQTYPNATQTLMPFVGQLTIIGGNYFAALFDQANDWFILPPLSVCSHISLEIHGTFTANDNGCNQNVQLEYDSSPGGDGSVFTAWPGGADGGLIPNAYPGKKVRAKLTQTSGVSLYGVSKALKIKFLKY